MVGDWKLNYMIKHILEALWTDRSDAVQEALQLIRDNYTEETAEKKNCLQISMVEARITKNEARLKQLLEMRMDNEISKEEYAKARSSVEKEIEECKTLLEELTIEDGTQEEVGINLKEIEETLNQLIDFSGPTIDNDIIDRLVMQVVPLQKDRVKWILNLAGGGNQIYAGVAGRKGKAKYDGSLSFDLPTFQPSTGYCQIDIDHIQIL